MADLRTPLYEWHFSRNARMVPFGGWEMPVQYSGIIDEHRAVRTAAGLFDVSHMGRLVFEGPGAEAFIQHLWTNDAASMKLGQVRYGLLCHEQGGILDDVLVYRLERRWLMVVNASNREKVLRWVESHKHARQALVTDRTFDWAMLAVQGPRALEAVAPLVGPVETLRYYHADPEPRGGRYGVELVSRTGYTGEDGCEIILPAHRVVELADELVDRQGVKPCGLGARDTLRLEAGMPLYGHELGGDIDPFQAGLGWAVKLDKGEFIGRDALRALKDDPARPRRVGLELEGRRAAREGCAVLREGRKVGRVTSGSFSPTLQKPIAMAYVEPGSAEVGTACEVDVRGQAVPAKVVPLPFYRRAK
ncbi:MAG TPA: glycine cleavage system aminomethyltransferase GcvT [Gemmataceae bacterium]